MERCKCRAIPTDRALDANAGKLGTCDAFIFLCDRYHDRSNVTLPGVQSDLAMAVLQDNANKTVRADGVLPASIGAVV